MFWTCAIGYAAAYYFVEGLLVVGGEAGRPASALHALYFSIVTMTTLGFGDLYANPKSNMGLILLMTQVLIGYVVLAALVTRLAVMFTSEGPSAANR